jgi:hypothetical protein
MSIKKPPMAGFPPMPNRKGSNSHGA